MPSLLRSALPGVTPVAFARAVGRADERMVLTTLGSADPSLVDMSTCVIVGSSTSRIVEMDGGPRLYTPRSA